MSEIRQAQRALTNRILEGAGHASHADRGAALHNCDLAKPADTLVDKVANHAFRVTDDSQFDRTDWKIPTKEMTKVQCAERGLPAVQYLPRL